MRWRLPRFLFDASGPDPLGDGLLGCAGLLGFHSGMSVGSAASATTCRSHYTPVGAAVRQVLSQPLVWQEMDLCAPRPSSRTILLSNCGSCSALWVRQRTPHARVLHGPSCLPKAQQQRKAQWRAVELIGHFISFRVSDTLRPAPSPHIPRDVVRDVPPRSIALRARVHQNGRWAGILRRVPEASGWSSGKGSRSSFVARIVPRGPGRTIADRQ